MFLLIFELLGQGELDVKEKLRLLHAAMADYDSQVPPGLSFLSSFCAMKSRVLSSERWRSFCRSSSATPKEIGLKRGELPKLDSPRGPRVFVELVDPVGKIGSRADLCIAALDFLLCSAAAGAEAFESAVGCRLSELQWGIADTAEAGVRCLVD